MSTVSYVVKRQGRRPTEAFSRDKLHASVFTTCLAVQVPEGQAESIAATVCDSVIRWLSDKPEVTSEDIRRKTADIMTKYHPEAAHLYKHHHMVI